MPHKRLNVISTDAPFSSTSTHPSRLTLKKELQARFERLWLLNPEQFNPLRNCMQKERLERTWSLLTAHFNPQGKTITDIGCAAGVFARRLRDAGAHVTAVDIAQNAFKHFQDDKDIKLIQDAMPTTNLNDQSFDAITCMEVIADLPPQDYRLFFAELARLIKPQGYILCSTPIDIKSEGGAQRLLSFAQTELEIIDSVISYHALYLHIKHFLAAPAHFVKGWKEPDFRQKKLLARKGLSHLWFRLNTTFFLIWIWMMFSLLTTPLLNFLKRSRSTLLKLEKICHFFWDEAGISHFILLGKRRPLQTEPPVEVPIERPTKRQIWE
jgi:2-polyprenyl-3-methyl-5-hydroxy-6-metoxy-1,4-benzoquinol methylase